MVFARLTLERYSIQGNNDNAKPTPAEAKDHLKALERSIELWNSGDLLDLLKEAETIQENLVSRKTSTNIVEISKKMFSEEIKKRNVNNAMKILSDNVKYGILFLTKQTLY